MPSSELNSNYINNLNQAGRAGASMWYGDCIVSDTCHGCVSRAGVDWRQFVTADTAVAHMSTLITKN